MVKEQEEEDEEKEEEEEEEKDAPREVKRSKIVKKFKGARASPTAKAKEVHDKKQRCVEVSVLCLFQFQIRPVSCIILLAYTLHCIFNNLLSYLFKIKKSIKRSRRQKYNEKKTHARIQISTHGYSITIEKRQAGTRLRNGPQGHNTP